MHINCTLLNPAYQKEHPDAKLCSILFTQEKNPLLFQFSNSVGLDTIEMGSVITLFVPKDTVLTASSQQLVNTQDWHLADPKEKGNNWLYSFTAQRDLSFESDEVQIQLQDIVGNQLGSDTIVINYDLNLVVKGVHFQNSSPSIFVYASEGKAQANLLEKLSITNPPMINHDAAQIGSGTIWTSPLNESRNLTPPIANTLHVNLKYNRSGGDALVEKEWIGHKVPKLGFSFSYGDTNLDLTNTLKNGEKGFNTYTSAWNIQCQLAPSSTPFWILIEPNQINNSPSWYVQPNPNNPHLFTKDSNPDLDLIFSHIISSNPPGFSGATMYVNWYNIPGFADQGTALDLPMKMVEKFVGQGTSPALPKELVGKPAILSFSGGPDRQASFRWKYNTPLSLYWRTFGTDEVRLVDTDDLNNPISFLVPGNKAVAPALTYEGGLIPKDEAAKGNLIPKDVLPDRHKKIYQLKTPQSRDHKTVTVEVYHLPPPIINDLTCSIQRREEGNSLIIKWSVQQSLEMEPGFEILIKDCRGVVQLHDKEVINQEGQLKIELSPDAPLLQQYVFQVAAYSLEENQIAEVTINVNWEQGQSFEVMASNILSGLPSMALSEDGKTLYTLSATNSPFVQHCSTAAAEIVQHMISSVDDPVKTILTVPGKQQLAVFYENYPFLSRYDLDAKKLTYVQPSSIPLPPSIKSIAYSVLTHKYYCLANDSRIYCFSDDPDYPGKINIIDYRGEGVLEKVTVMNHGYVLIVINSLGEIYTCNTKNPPRELKGRLWYSKNDYGRLPNASNFIDRPKGEFSYIANKDAFFKISSFVSFSGRFLDYPSAEKNYIVFAPNQDQLFFSESGDNPCIGTLDMKTKEVSTIPVSYDPGQLIFHPDGSQLFVASCDKNRGYIFIPKFEYLHKE